VKRAVILHGTDATPRSNWFSWLQQELEGRGYNVLLPQLPGADKPNAKVYTDFLLAQDWDWQDNLLIGHSSGAVEILHLLQHLPPPVTVKTAVLAGVFSAALAEKPGWEHLKGMFIEPLEFKVITGKAEKFLFIHGTDDPWCDPLQARHIAQEASGEYVEVPGGQHFSASLDPAYTRFPLLLTLLEERAFV
jgi:predicted alpha/beta hydrolase family esterase